MHAMGRGEAEIIGGVDMDFGALAAANASSSAQASLVVPELDSGSAGDGQAASAATAQDHTLLILGTGPNGVSGIKRKLEEREDEAIAELLRFHNDSWDLTAGDYPLVDSL